MTWSNKWSITPRATAGSPPDYTQDPLYKISFGSGTTVNEYTNWYLTDYLGAAPPSMALSRLCIAMHDEETLVDTPITAWRYFCSKEMQSYVNATFPVTDGRPRVWRLGKTANTNWAASGG
jgi:hypothetical protein